MAFNLAPEKRSIRFLGCKGLLRSNLGHKNVMIKTDCCSLSPEIMATRVILHGTVIRLCDGFFCLELLVLNYQHAAPLMQLRLERVSHLINCLEVEI